MSGEDGSTTLTPEQADINHDLFGVRYHAIQTNADMPSRKERRAMGQRQRLHGQGLMVATPKSTWRFIRRHAR